MKKITAVLFSLVFTLAFSQKEVNIWYFGSKAGLDFNSCTGVKVIHNSAMYAKEGSAVMSDANGALLFYTNGNKVYNKNHTVMPNGTGLKGGPTSSCSQNALIIPDPGNTQKYYIFTTDEEENGLAYGFNYSVVDMTLNGGLGDVTTKNTNLLGAAKSGEKITAYTRTGGGYWVVAHGWGNNNFYTYPVTATGVGAAVITSIGKTHSGQIFNAIGPMKISPDGKKLASVTYFSGTFSPGFWELFDFNTTTGVLSNAMSFTTQEPFGLEFSPNSNKVYISAVSTYQFDISSNNQTTIQNSKIKVSPGADYTGPLQLGPDCKIYVTTQGAFLDVISAPNATGAACSYNSKSINLGGDSSLNSTPNFLRSYFANMTCASGSQSVSAIPGNPISCKNGNDGTATVSATGCNSPYTYTWSTTPIQTGQTATGLQAGVYTITVADQSGSTTTTTISITQPNGINAGTLSIQNASCGSSNGSATISGTNGGNTPYTYSWSASGATGTSVSGLAVGNYSLTITDGKGCTKDTTFSVNSSGGAAVTINAVTPVSCNGGKDGSASVTATGSGLTYTWSPSGGSAATASGLAVGVYTVTIKDANQCQSTVSISITEPAAMTVNNSTQASSCSGIADGSVTIGAGGGATPYVYSWSNGATGTNTNLTGLTSGNYSVTVIDSKGCSQLHPFTITQNGNLFVSVQNASLKCNSDSDGVLSASASGGNPGYTYSWSAGGTNATTSGLSAGNYSLTVTDSKGCITTSTGIITEPPAITITSTSTIASANASNGTASATGSGGSAPYSYSWLTIGSSTAAVSNLPSGTYTIIVTDAQGCSNSATVVITSESPCRDPFVPTAFSPNGDGMNDVLYVREACIKTFTLKVFTRWGEQVFETSDSTVGWNGIFRARNANTGVYVYVLQYVSITGEEKIVKGNITLSR